jgi:hypothetical protein
MVLLLLCLSGCPKPTEPGGPLNAGPYPECRAIVGWLRAKYDDPEANVTRWGPRTEESEGGGSVLIEVHYQATIGKVPDGHWTQTLRVIGRNNIMEETQPVAE